MYRDERIVRARSLVDRVRQKKPEIRAAAVVSSVAFGDDTPVSDVDILMVERGREEDSAVTRQVTDGTVYEWMIVPESSVSEPDELLGDAGLVHDLRRPIVLLDEDGLLRHTRDALVRRYRERDGVLRRARDQRDRAAEAIERLEARLDEGDALGAVGALVGAVKHLLGLPRALVNGRCTMGRGFLFADTAARELGWERYVESLAALIGIAGLSREETLDLTSRAERIVRLLPVPKKERRARRLHLRVARWLADRNIPEYGAWPLLFWTSGGVERARPLLAGKALERLDAEWLELASPLGLTPEADLRKKLGLAVVALGSASARLEDLHEG